MPAALEFSLLRPCAVFLRLACLAVCAFSPGFARAQDAAPPTVGPEQPSLMKVLADHEKHNLENERWNAYGQFTYIYGAQSAFRAPYTNLNGSINSLTPRPDQSYTGSSTLYLGARLWKNGQAYFVPELIAEKPLSQLRGLGSSIQDFELQKSGSETPVVYVSRIFLRQTVNLGGQEVTEESSPLQLGKTGDRSRRIVFVAGNFSILDFFDKNAFNIDPRRGLYNIAFLTYAAYDFASNARGYSWGAVSELYWDNWAVRYGRITPPKNPNQLPVDFRILKVYGDQIEFEHNHQVGHRDGTVRVLAFRNHENIGRFADAVSAFQANPAENAAACPNFNYGSNNSTAPDLCWVRRPNNKVGIGGFDLDFVGNHIGVVARGLYADGKTEVDAYNSADRSLSFGTLAKGATWSRPRDIAGLAYNIGWVSKVHADYLGMGGIDGFVGDGAITQGTERALDLFYNVNYRKGFWFSGDFQHISNPGFNLARGPLNVYSLRIHGEF